MNNICPICKGEGKEIIVVRNAQTKRMKTVTEWCLCTKSEFVSKTYRLLKIFGKIYLPLDKIHESMTLDLEDLSMNPNLYIKDTSIRTFFFHVKSVIMRYRFINNPPLIYLCTALDILKKFYVEQEDRSKPRLTDLNRYDLLVFTLDTLEGNKSLGDCVAQVIYNRDCELKPTWIYLPQSTALESTREFTDVLKSYMDPDNKKYQEISIVETDVKIKPIITETQKKAEGFKL